MRFWNKLLLIYKIPAIICTFKKKKFGIPNRFIVVGEHTF